MASIRAAAGFALAGGLILAASTAGVRGDGAPMAGATDWPMWGGTPSRNMVSAMTGLPDKWDVKTKKNVKWVADLGSQTYGNPPSAGGKVFVGTNNELLRDPKQPGDRGVLMAFNEDDRRVPVADHAREAVAAGRVNDWPFQGIASSPLVEGDTHLLRQQPRRGDVPRHRGLPRRRQNDGPVKDEKLTGETDADVVWKFDMMEEVGAFPHNLSNSSPVVHGDLIYVMHVERAGREPRQHPVAEGAGDHRPRQEHRQAGVGRQLGRRQDPARPVVDAVGRRRSAAWCRWCNAQGDGWVRGYEALTGKKLWEFDTNPKDSVWPKTRNEVISTPVIFEQRRLHRRTARIRSTARASATPTPSTPPSAATSRPPGSSGTTTRSAARSRPPAINDGLIYWPDFSGFLHCLDQKTGQAVLDARHVRRDLGLADGRRRQGLPRRRGRRRRRSCSRARRSRCSAR